MKNNRCAAIADRDSNHRWLKRGPLVKQYYAVAMPQVVILSLFLGLVTGMQTVALRVGPAVKSVRIELGGREAATLTGDPWTAKVDFGAALIPRELVAI